MAHESLTTNFLAAWNGHDAAAAVALMTDDCLFEPSVGPLPWGDRIHGRDGIEAWALETFQDIPDIHWELIRRITAESHVVFEFSITGSPKGAEPFHIHACDILGIRDGLIASKRAYRKSAGTRDSATVPQAENDMLEVNLTAELASSAGVVWQTVGNFNGLPAWHPLVRESFLEAVPGGVGRRVTIGGDDTGHRELTERLVAFDAFAREYAYTIVSGPVPFTDYVGRFSVAPHGNDRCKFAFRSRFRPKPGHLHAEADVRIRNFYQVAIDNLVRMFGA